MKIIEEHIRINNEDLVLTNQRAIYWQREQALILSDLHIGKTAHFRKHGIPMPDAILQNDLERLKGLIHYYKVGLLLVVGDLFHAEANIDMITFKCWLKQFKALNIILIKGNHDQFSEQMLTDFKIEIKNTLTITPFTFVHESLGLSTEKFTISGHEHPGILIKGKGRQKLKLPCYQITSNQMILPAFSLFTGLNVRNSLKDADFYAFTDENFFHF
jgi:DNA ligase-associated metallophosphoesterase